MMMINNVDEFKVRLLLLFGLHNSLIFLVLLAVYAGRSGPAGAALHFAAQIGLHWLYTAGSGGGGWNRMAESCVCVSVWLLSPASFAMIVGGSTELCCFVVVVVAHFVCFCKWHRGPANLVLAANELAVCVCVNSFECRRKEQRWRRCRPHRRRRRRRRIPKANLSHKTTTTTTFSHRKVQRFS